MSAKAPRLAVLGAGPIGLEAALAGALRGWDVRVYEAHEVGASVLAWGHVRLFSPWSMNVSARGRSRLAAAGWQAPPSEACPTGRDLVEGYLRPLASLPEIAGRIETGWRVVAVGRSGLRKGERIGEDARLRYPFRLHLRDAEGRERHETADFVVDATGVWCKPNGIGIGGLDALGERAVADRIRRGLDDVLGASIDRYAGRTTLVVGSGHSAATVVLDLVRLAERGPGTRAIWAIRSGSEAPCVEIDADPLPERARIAAEANAIARGGHPAVEVQRSASVERLERRGDRVAVTLAVPGGSLVVDVDAIVSCTGFGPDETLHRELQVHQCYATLGTMKLAAALVGSASTDCLAQTSHGPESLRNPEPGFVVLGHKSYGRSPGFLLRIGHAQVEDGFKLLDGWVGSSADRMR